MQFFRVVLTVGALCLLDTARADVRYIFPSQQLYEPGGYTRFGQDVAIDGGFLVVLAFRSGGQDALLYHRSSSTGQFVYRRVLQSWNGPEVTGEVAMKNGIAAVRFGTQVNIFEYAGGDYVRGRSATPLAHPGNIAISRKKVLVGGNGCDDDAALYTKGSDGNWGISSVIDDQQGACLDEGMIVDLNYDYAVIKQPYTSRGSAWRLSGNSWVPAGSLVLPPNAPNGTAPWALENSTAVAQGNYVFLRSGNTWSSVGRATPANYYNTGGGGGYAVVQRDGLLVTTEAIYNAQPYVYVQTSPGHFEHAAILYTNYMTLHHDVSGLTVVAATQYSAGDPYGIDIFTLPAEVIAPPPVVNDFEQRDVSNLTFSGGQFELAKRGSNDVLAQRSGAGPAVALINETDWADNQRIEADISPGVGSGDGWAGVVARYVDANNHYFVALRSSGNYELYKRLNGTDTLLRAGAIYHPGPRMHVTLVVDAGNIDLWVNGAYTSRVTDQSLLRGPVGVATFHAQADFDNLHAASTEAVFLFNRDFGPYGYLPFQQPLNYQRGDWRQLEDEDGYNAGFAQLSKSGTALAWSGVPVENQEVIGRMRLDAFSTAVTSGWFGLLARFVDPQNYYYVAIRSNNQAQIRKTVNGVSTVLASAPLTVQPGEYHDFRFLLIGDQLQLFVDGVQVAGVHDSTFGSGQYGFGTYATAATWESFTVLQP